MWDLILSIAISLYCFINKFATIGQKGFKKINIEIYSSPNEKYALNVKNLFLCSSTPTVIHYSC